MFPSLGRIFVAAFSDEGLHTELTQKALFWTNPSFYGVNPTALHPAAVEVRFSAARPVCDRQRFVGASMSIPIETRFCIRSSCRKHCLGRIPLATPTGCSVMRLCR
jgi:hypothetical protein